MRKTLKLRAIETVLIVADDSHREFYEDFCKACLELEADPSVFIIPGSARPAKKVPNALRQALLSSNVVITAFDYVHGETSFRNALHQTAKQNNAKVLNLVGVPGTALHGPAAEANQAEVAERASKLHHLLREVETIEVVSGEGTRVSFRPGSAREVDNGLEAVAGSIIGFPGGEVFLQPEMASFNGTIVVDGTVTGLGLLKKPLTLKVERGEVVSAKGHGAEHLLAAFEQDSAARKVSEFGLGTNQSVTVSEHSFVSEKALGTCHFGLGNSAHFGGSVISTTHLAVLLKEPTVKFDGKPVIEKGKFLLG